MKIFNNKCKIFPVFIANIFLWIVGCQTVNFTALSRTAEQEELLNAALKSTAVQKCEFWDQPWQMSVPIKNPKVIIGGDALPVFVYEGIFRDAIKTVWQPLSLQFEKKDVGFAIGDARNFWNVDFSLLRDSQKNIWTSYRFKPEGSESFSGMIEFLPKGNGADVKRLAIPTISEHSVQQIWILPLQQSKAHIVVRSMGNFLEKKGVGSIFTVYLVDGLKSTVYKTAETKDVLQDFTNVSFYGAAQPTELLALGISQTLLNNSIYGSATKKYKYQIVAKKLFSKSSETVVFFESNQPINNFTTKIIPQSNNSFLLAWARETENGVYPKIEWMSASIEALDWTKQQAYPKPYSYTPDQFISDLDLKYLYLSRNSKVPQIFLTWFNHLEGDFFYSLLPLNGQEVERRHRSVSVAVPQIGGKVLGVFHPYKYGQPHFLMIGYNTADDEHSDSAPMVLRQCEIRVSEIIKNIK